MTTQSEQDPTRAIAIAAAYLYAKEKLCLSEEQAKNFARTDLLRNKFFFEAFRLSHNYSVKFLYLVPILLFILFLILGFMLRTNWWFYAPALLFLSFWVNGRKWSNFWTPILYWFKPYLDKSQVAENDIDPTDWKSYFFLPYPHGRANIKQMVNACFEEVQIFGHRYILRSLFGSHIIKVGAFAILAYIAWK